MRNDEREEKQPQENRVMKIQRKMLKNAAERLSQIML
jgi:hypothetical protein